MKLAWKEKTSSKRRKWKYQARQFFSTASSLIEGIFFLGERKNKGNGLSHDIVTKAEEGDSAAQIELGKAYYNTFFLENNVAVAFDWIYRSAEQGNMEAQFRLGDLYALGHGTSKSIPDAYKWYTKSAIQGYKKALIRIHNLYQEDIKMHCRGQINSEEEEWASKKFKEENKIRELNEYRMEQNKSILNDAIDYYTDQFKHYQSSDQEDPAVQLNLAFLYQHGYGARKCTRWAFEYYTMAAEQGNIVAQYNLGELYQKHTNMKFNYRHAFKWYTESARGGNRDAQRSLGYFYLKGLATDIDYGMAFFWYTKAAETGDSEAQVTLGKLYRKGDYVKQDLPRAVKWYSLAARQGNIVAQNCLSQLHQRGKLDGIQLEQDISEYVTEGSMKSRLCTKLSIDVFKLGDSPNFKQLTELGRRVLIGDGQAMYEIGLMYLNGDNGFNRDQDTGIKWIKNAAHAKHKDAQVMIADLYQKGDSIEQDYHKVTIWYQTLAKQKDAFAQYNIGIMYNEGLGVRRDPLEASKWFIWAADQGNSNAQHNLGCLRLDGKGLRQDENEAVNWFYKSAQQKNIYGCYRLGEIYFEGRHKVEKNLSRGLKLMEFAANNGSTQAQLEMAHRFEMGVDVNKSAEKSIKYYTMAADAGNPKAQFQMAIAYLKGRGVDTNYIEAYTLLKKVKYQGHIDAERMFQFPMEYDWKPDDYSKVTNMFMEVTYKRIDNLSYCLGYSFEHRIGEYAKMNHKIAETWYSAASDNGDSRGDYCLGVMHEYGKGVDKSLYTAIEYYKKASVKGNKDAIYRLACMYYNGYGVAQDFLEAFQYYTKASVLGHQKAREALMIFEDNKESKSSFVIEHSRVQVTDKVKVSMLEKATEGGYTRLQYQIGVWYQNNEDYQNAFLWLRRAADLGVTDAYYRLGTFYEEGQEVEQDYEEAANMYQKATDKEHEDACYRLGHLYQYGKGVELDYLIAYQFYKKAADMGHEAAQEVLNITLDYKIKSSGTFIPSSQEYIDSLLMCKDVARRGDTEVQFQVGFAYDNCISPRDCAEAYKWYSMAAKKSHREAIYHLGLLYEEGLGVSRNYQKAYQLLYRAGELRNGDALYQLGKAFHYGRGVDFDPKKAVEYYTLAAELGNPEYQCEVGRLYEEGELVQKDRLEALKWYTKAYLQGYDGASSKVYDMYENKPYESFFFQRLLRNLSIASFGHFRLNDEYRYSDYGAINNQLGILCASGLGIDRDPEKALYYFSIKYSENPHTLSIKTVFDSRNGIDLREKSAILELIGDNEDIMDRIEDVGELFELGVSFFGFMTQDECTPSTDQYRPKSFEDIPQKKNHMRALKCLKKAAERMYPEALDRLVMYYCGYGVEKNCEEGDRYFADIVQNDTKLVKNIAILFHTHQERQNLSKAFEWYKRLEKMIGNKRNSIDYITLQIGLGLLYENGDGVEQDCQMALGYYQTVANAKISIGLHHLALMHYYGKGVEVNYVTSLRLFSQAMAISKYENVQQCLYQQRIFSGTKSVYCTMSNARVNAETSYYLGLHFKNGQGVGQDKEKAQQYFRNAYQDGCQRACDEFTSDDS